MWTFSKCLIVTLWTSCQFSSRSDRQLATKVSNSLEFWCWLLTNFKLQKVLPPYRVSIKIFFAKYSLSCQCFYFSQNISNAKFAKSAKRSINFFNWSEGNYLLNFTSGFLRSKQSRLNWEIYCQHCELYNMSE